MTTRDPKTAAARTTRPAGLWVVPVTVAILFLGSIDRTPALVAVGAFAPPVAYAVLVAVLAPPREPLPLLVGLFLWGAVAAEIVAETINIALGNWAADAPDSPALPLGPVLWGPLVEEAAKALGLAALLGFGRERLRSVHGGIVCGALVGLGFAAAENLDYHLLAVVQGGPAGLARAVFVRGILQGLNHATFTAALGAGIGFARATHRPAARALAPFAGFAAGLVQHGAWNGVASHAITELLCDAATPGGACRPSPSAEALFFEVPAMVAIFVAPGLVALAWLARKGRR